MPRPVIDLEPYKRDIIHLLNEGRTQQDIQAVLINSLGIRVSERTLRARLQEWGIRKHVKIDAENIPSIHQRISELYYDSLSDSHILRILRAENITMTAASLIRIRKELKLRIRTSAEERDNADIVDASRIRRELSKGTTHGYGRNLLYTHCRKQKILVSRDRIHQIVKEIDPEAVENRRCDLQRHRGQYITPGPNFIWSIDGYCKLDLFGFQIYGAIDAYSRYVVWAYVGVSAHTGISCLRQFLNAVGNNQTLPRFIRSDHGVETTLLAAAHHVLRKTESPDLPFSDCYLYGTSTSNQRIESWWSQLSGSLVYRWRTYFKNLDNEGSFRHSHAADRIALLYIYMPMIRQELQSYVETWNNHYIRAQTRRPNAIPGRPKYLYYHPNNAVDQKEPLHRDVLDMLMQDVAEYDLDEFLPAETSAWCGITLSAFHIDMNIVELDDVRPYRNEQHYWAYMHLREAIEAHIIGQSDPHLLETAHPTGGVHWNPAMHQSIQAFPF